jgi:hypothetical protein
VDGIERVVKPLELRRHCVDQREPARGIGRGRKLGLYLRSNVGSDAADAQHVGGGRSKPSGRLPEHWDV